MGIVIFNISEAARIIQLLVKNPSEGKKKKKMFDQEVGLLEACLESVPSTFIITVIWASAGDLANNETINIEHNIRYQLDIISYSSGCLSGQFNIQSSLPQSQDIWCPSK